MIPKGLAHPSSQECKNAVGRNGSLLVVEMRRQAPKRTGGVREVLAGAGGTKTLVR